MNTKAVAKAAAVAAVLLGTPCIALAQAWYVGASAGQTTAKEWCGKPFNTPAGPVAVTQCDDKDSGGKVFGGYWFTQYLAVEVSYIDWGKFSAVSAAPTNAKAQSWGFGTVAALPIGDSFQVFGKLGVLQTDSQVAGGGKDTESHYGVGAIWSLGKSWGLRAEWERAETNALELVSVGVQFRF